MKRIVYSLLTLCFCFSLFGCGVSQSDNDALIEETSSLQTSVELITSEKESFESESLSGETEETPDEFFSRVESECEEIISNSVDITSGDFYDSVSSIYPNVALTDMEDSVSISIFLQHKSELEDSVLFFDIVSQIIEISKLEDYYSGVTFMMFVDESLITMLTIIDYTSPSSFTSSEPLILEEKYKESIETLYSIGFSSSDMLNKFNESLDELKEKYNLSN